MSSDIRPSVLPTRTEAEAGESAADKLTEARHSDRQEITTPTLIDLCLKLVLIVLPIQIGSFAAKSVNRNFGRADSLKVYINLSKFPPVRVRKFNNKG